LLSALQADVDAGVVLPEVLDGVAVADLSAVVECGGQDGGEVGAGDGDVAVGVAHGGLRVEGPDGAAARIELGDGADVEGALAQPTGDAHLLGDIEAGTPEIDGVTAAARC